MLNMPQRNANATASPVRISVVVCSSVCDRLYADVFDDARRRVEHPVQPGAVEDVAVGEQRVVAGREHDEAADEEREQRRQHRHDQAAGLLLQRDARGDRRRLGRRRAPTRGGAPCGSSVGHAASVFPPAPSISSPICVLRDLAGVLAGDLALVDDEDPVGEREDLLELERDEQDRAALVALGDEAAVEELDRPHVEAARRLGRDQHLRVARDLARDDDLLLVAAGEAARARLRAAAAHVELLDQPCGALDHPRGKQPAPLRVRRLRVVVQPDVLRDGELEDETAPLTVLRDVPDAGVEHVARVAARAPSSPRPRSCRSRSGAAR